MTYVTRVQVKPTNRRSRLYFAGLEFAPPLTREEKAAAEMALQQALASGDYSKVPPPRESPIAVWSDDDGRHYVLLLDEQREPLAVRFRIGPHRDPRRDDLSRGGFVPADLLQQMQRQGRPSARANQGAAIRQGVDGEIAGSDSANPDAPAPNLERRKRMGELLELLQPGIQGLGQQVAGQVLGSLLKSGGGSPQHGAADVFFEGGLDQAGASLAGMGIGGLLSAGSSALFTNVWGVDDSSTLGEKLAHKYTQELVGILQQELQEQAMGALFGKEPKPPGPGPKDLKETFFGIAAADGTPVVRKGDKTDHGGEVKTGAMSVLVVGKEAARMLDKQECPKDEPGPTPHIGGTIDQGVVHVLVEGQMLAGESLASICTGCGLATLLSQGQTSVQVGGVVTPPPIEKPVKPAGTASKPPGSSSSAEKKMPSQQKRMEDPPSGGSSVSSERNGEPNTEPFDEVDSSNGQQSGKQGADEGEAESIDQPDLDDFAEGGAREAKREVKALEQELERAERVHDEAAVREATANSTVDKLEQALDTAKEEEAAARASNVAPDFSETSQYEHTRTTEAAERAAAKVAALERQLDLAKDAAAVASKETSTLSKLLDAMRRPQAVFDAAGKFMGAAGNAITLGTGVLNANEAITTGDYPKADKEIGKTVGDLALGAGGAALGVFLLPVSATVGTGIVVIVGASAVGSYAGEQLGELAGTATGGNISEALVDLTSWIRGRL